MEEQKGWMKAKKRGEALLAQVKRFTGISVITTLAVGPLLYFGVFAGETTENFDLNLHGAATEKVEIATTVDVTLSNLTIPLPEREDRKTKFKNEDLKIGINTDSDDKKIQTIAQELDEENLSTFGTIFQEEELEMRSIKITKTKETPEINVEVDVDGDLNLDPEHPELMLAPLADEYVDEYGISHSRDRDQEEETLVMNNVQITAGPNQIKNEKDASQIARVAIKKYTQTLENHDDFVILPDTSKLEKQKKSEQLVLSKLVNHNGKWYIWFNQYHEGKPVFDGGISLIITESKKILTITDTIKLNLPNTDELKVGKALAKQEAKAVLEWDDLHDEVEHIEQGFYDGQIAYKLDMEAHNPLGTWEVYVDGVDGEILEMMSDIRMQTPETPATPEPEVLPDPEIEEPNPETENSATTDPEIEDPESENSATTDPETLLEATVGQILGYVFPQTPEDERIQVPFRDQYVYLGDSATLETTNADGYFENLEQEWYSMFLSGPYVTVYDDAATANVALVTTDSDGYFENLEEEWYSMFLSGPYVTIYDDAAAANTVITNNTPGLPFVWDEPYASQEAINAFYHTNKIRDYFYTEYGYEMNENIPTTVNSELSEMYTDGCNSWFNNTEKTIELGDGDSEWCANDTNYALSSDVIYHEYTHAITEDLGHWPYVSGSESAAISEGLSDYFATTINDDSVWGEVASPDRTRDLNNTLTYQANMGGDTHMDSLVFSGALWDLRAEIGAEETDALIFNTLYQNKTHFETFMYGMIVEDDDDEDFSNGTPHLIEIIQAFENHGIGPGVLNFNGLPIDPEAWSQLLADAGIEGEEQDIYSAWSGTACHWAGTAGASNLTIYGGVCSVSTGTTSNLAYNITINDGGTLAVYGTLNVTGSSGYINNYDLIQVNSGTLNVTNDIYVRAGCHIITYNGGSTTIGDFLFNYGTVRNGLTGNAGSLTVQGEGRGYNGSVLETWSGSTGSIDIQGEYEMQGGSTFTLNAGTTAAIDLLNATATSTTNTTLTINGTLNSGQTGNDINLYGYDSNNKATMTIGSAGYVYVGNLNIGTSTTNGGTLTNGYRLYAYAPTIIGNYGVLTNNAYFRNSYGTTSQSVSLYDTAFLENTDNVNIYGYTHMYDNSEILNGGIDTGSYFRTSRMEMSTNAVFTNDTSYGHLDVNTGAIGNDILLTNDAVLDINAGSSVDLYDDLYLYGDTSVTNDGDFYMYGGLTGNNLVSMSTNSTITNGSSADFYIGGTTSVTIPTYGELDLAGTGNAVTNYGDMRFYTLDINYGTVTNSTAGNMDITGNADVYRGKLHNASGAHNLDITGTLALSGSSISAVGTLDNDAGHSMLSYGMDVAGLTTMNGYSLIDNSYDLNFNGGLGINANNVDIKNDYAQSDIYVYNALTVDFDAAIDMDGVGGDLEIAGFLVIKDTATFNMGTSSYLDIGGLFRLDNSGTYTNNGGFVNTDGRLRMTATSTFTNTSGTINVNTTSSPSSDDNYGDFLITNDYSSLTTAVTNGGTINIDDDLVMNATFTTPGTVVDTDAKFINSGTITVSNGTADIDEEAFNLFDTYVFENNGGTLNITGKLKIEDYGTFNAPGAGTNIDISDDLQINGNYVNPARCQFNITGGTLDVTNDVNVEEDCHFNNGDATGTNYGAVTIGGNLNIAIDTDEEGTNEAASSTTNGGTIDVSGDIYVDDDGALSVGYAGVVTVTNDLLVQDTGSDLSAYASGAVTVDGTDSQLIVTGNVRMHDTAVIGTTTNDSSITLTDDGTLLALNNFYMYKDATLNIGEDGVADSGGHITIVSQSFIFDDSAITMYGDGSLRVEDTVAPNPASSSTNSLFILYDNSSLSLYGDGVIDIDSTKTTTATDGVLTIFDSAAVTNEDTLSANVISMGTTLLTGGILINRNGGTINVTNNTTSPTGLIVLHGGEVMHAVTATAFNVTKDIQIDDNFNDLTPSTFYAGADVTIGNNLYINKNGTFTLGSGTVDVTASVRIYSNSGGSCTDIGQLLITEIGTTNPTLNTSYLYLGNDGTSPGYFENDGGTVNISHTAKIYGCTIDDPLKTIFKNYHTGESKPILNVTGPGGIEMHGTARMANLAGEVNVTNDFDIYTDISPTSSDEHINAHLESYGGAAIVDVGGTLSVGDGARIFNGDALIAYDSEIKANVLEIYEDGAIDNHAHVNYTTTFTIEGTGSNIGKLTNRETGYLYTTTGILYVEPYGYLINEANTDFTEFYGVNIQNLRLNHSAQAGTSGHAYVYNTGHFIANDIAVYAAGDFYNDQAYGTGTPNATAQGTDPLIPNCAYDNGNLVSVDVNRLYLYSDVATGQELGEFHNYDDLCISELHAGIIDTSIKGGGLYGTEDSRIHVDNATTTAAEVYEGKIAINNDNGTDSYFRVGDLAETGGRITIQGSATGDYTKGVVQNAITLAVPTVLFYDMYIEEKGEYVESGTTVVKNNLEISGDYITNGACDPEVATDCGRLIIFTGASEGDFTVNGTTNVNAGGNLFNLRFFTSDGTVTVADDGMISSELEASTTFDSYFDLQGTPSLVTDGSVLMGNHVSASDDVNVQGGTTQLGYDDNTGDADIAGDLNVTGGTFESYEDLIIHGSATVDDAGATDAHAKFLGELADGSTCHTEILENFSIINAGQATIACEYTNAGGGWDAGVHVDQASTNGFTYVGGGAGGASTSTLYLDTSLKTREMYVGYDGTNSENGIVTHNVTSTGFPIESKTSNLRVDELLDVKATTGSIDVSGKSSYGLTGALPHGGSYGGKGQVDSGDTPNVENGYKEPTDGPALHLGEIGCTLATGGGCSNFSRAGGIIYVTVGDSSTQTGTLINNGDILSNGFECGANGADCNEVFAGYGEGAGSGGSINLIVYGDLEGSGNIIADGGDDTQSNNVDSAGGGGRITIMSTNNVKPNNDGTFSGDFTGYVSAIGGLGDNAEYATGNRYAAPGTTSYAFFDTTINQAHGWTVIDGKDKRNLLGIIDVDGDGGESVNDYTDLQSGFTLESLRAINGGLLDIQDSNNHRFQQCVEDADSDILTKGGQPYYWNFYQTHGSHTYTDTVSTIITDDYCKSTADPPPSEGNLPTGDGNGVYINNSGTGAQTADYGVTSGDPVHVADITPAISAKYLDGQIGGTSVSEATDAHIQIATSQAALDANNPNICDTSIGTVGHLDLTTWIADGARSEDLLLPYVTTDCQLDVTELYHWRVHFKYDEDGDDQTTGDDEGWGLWSKTQYLEVDEGGTITLGTCPSAAGAYDMVLDDFDLMNATPDNFDKQKCSIGIEATVAIGTNASKTGDGFEHTANASQIITDTHLLDADTVAAGLDGLNNAIPTPTDMNEVAFYVDSSSTEFTYGNGINGDPYNTVYHYLPHPGDTYDTTINNLVESTGAIDDESFDFWIGAYVHEILNDIIPWAETYEETVTITLTSNP